MDVWRTPVSLDDQPDTPRRKAKKQDMDSSPPLVYSDILSLNMGDLF